MKPNSLAPLRIGLIIRWGLFSLLVTAISACGQSPTRGLVPSQIQMDRPTHTATSTLAPTRTPSPSATSTPTPSATFTPRPTATSTATITPSPTLTSTATPTVPAPTPRPQGQVSPTTPGCVEIFKSPFTLTANHFSTEQLGGGQCRLKFFLDVEGGYCLFSYYIDKSDEGPEFKIVDRIPGDYTYETIRGNGWGGSHSFIVWTGKARGFNTGGAQMRTTQVWIEPISCP